MTNETDIILKLDPLPFTGNASIALGTLNAGFRWFVICGLDPSCPTHFVPGDAFGGTVQDPNGTPLPYTLRIVPEPSALLLLGIATAAYGAGRRRKLGWA